MSLGSGNALYQATRQRLLGAFDRAVLRDQVELLDQLCSLFQAAHKQGLAAAGADLRDFAFRRLPPALRQRQPVLFDPYTIRPAEVVRDALQKVCGPRDVLAFQMLLVENAPPWRRHLDADRPRDRPAARLGKLRKEAGGALGDLEPRLLAVVIDDLKKELRAGRSGGGICDYRLGGTQEFWPDHTDRFARAAEEVHAEQEHVGRGRRSRRPISGPRTSTAATGH